MRSGSLGLALALAACAPEIPATTGTVTREQLRSQIVGADYQLIIRVPPDYEAEPTKQYPLIVQLDPTFAGLRQFDVTAGLVSQHAAAGEWPEAIVVGVDDVGANQRLRDYTLPEPPSPDFSGEGADRFFRALGEEIVPHVEATYRVDPARRILIGHSAGATFAWYAALRHDPVAPPLFSGVLAADTGIDEALFTYERWHAGRSSALPLRLYSASAVYNGAVQKITVDAMRMRLDQRGYDEFVFEHELFETDHGGVILPAFENGLAMLLEAE